MPRWSLLLNKASLLTTLTLPVWVLIGYFSYSDEVEPVDVEQLVPITGSFAELTVDEVGKTRQDLYIRLQESDLWYATSLTYPTKFRFGAATLDRLTVGTRLTVLLEPDEHVRDPRRNRLTGMLWKTLVGLSSNEVVHLDPADHYFADRENKALGKLIIPIFAGLSLVLIVGGYFKESKDRRSVATDTLS